MTGTEIAACAAFIDGAAVAGDGDAIEVVSPVDGRVVAVVHEAGPELVARATAAARSAFASWSSTFVEDRAAILERLATLLEAAGEDIAGEVSTEMGMPLALARITQVDLAASVLRRTADTARATAWSTAHDGYTVHSVAAGVVAAITPWNMPVYQVVAKVAPALAAGCTVVLKPSEMAPSAPLRLAALALAAGLPAGAFNVVFGTGPVTGEALVCDEQVDVVSFTGSVRAGRRVAALAGEGIRRVALELGGKSATLVLDDADLSVAVPSAVRAAFLNSGQACNAPTRLLVPRGRLPEVEALAAQTVAALRVGPPAEAGTDLGPLVSSSQHERVVGFVDRALAAGARVVARGETPLPAPYLAPIVLGGVGAGSEIAQQEVFGPVLVVLPYDDEADAVRIANGTAFGLSAEVWSPDPARVARVATQLRAGQIKVNGVRTRERPDAPFGGFGLSGVGRELGSWGLHEFLETKAVLA